MIERIRISQIILFYVMSLRANFKTYFARFLTTIKFERHPEFL